MTQFSASLNMMFEDEPFEDRVKRAAAAGFDGIEVIGWDRDMTGLAEHCQTHDLTFIYLSGDRPPLTDPKRTAAAVESIKETVELATQVGSPKVNVTSGPSQSDRGPEIQREAIVEVLQRALPAAEAAGVTLVFEGLNSRIDVPNQFITTAGQAAEIVTAVDSPNVRLLFDVYHEQVSHGDVIRSFQDHANIIDHIQIADNPGRYEPGTGELNYENILPAILDTGYDGFIGCEFQPTVTPKRALKNIRSILSAE